MKLNIYSYIVFGLILVILYPLIFYFSDKRITKANSNLLTYQYDVRGFLSVDNISEAANDMNRITENLNDKYFNNLPVVKFSPQEKFSTVKSYSVPERDINLLFDTDLKILRPIHSSIKKNYELILVLGDIVVFYYDLNNIFNFIKDELQRTKYTSDRYGKNCKNINHKLISMEIINYSVYEFNFSINQKIGDQKFTNQNEITSVFQNCINNRLNVVSKNLRHHLKNFHKLQVIDFDQSFKNFNKIKENYPIDNKKNQELKNNIYEAKNKLMANLMNFELNLQTLQPAEIETNRKYQKNFNIHVVSFILTFLITLILFYVLFFLKNQIKILKKLF